MPMLDFRCDVCGEIDECFYHPSDAKTERPMCCGQKMTQVHVGSPNVVWARPLGDYHDSSIPGLKAEGHWVDRVRSNRNRDGSPDREYITSRQQQLKFCKEEGLADPLDTRAVEATPDGLSVRTQGNRNSWS